MRKEEKPECCVIKNTYFAVLKAWLGVKILFMLRYTLPLISKEAREEIALSIKSCPMLDSDRGQRREWGIGGN